MQWLIQTLAPVVYKMKEETDFNDVDSASKLRHIMVLK